VSLHLLVQLLIMLASKVEMALDNGSNWQTRTTKHSYWLRIEYWMFVPLLHLKLLICLSLSNQSSFIT